MTGKERETYVELSEKYVAYLREEAESSMQPKDDAEILFHGIILATFQNANVIQSMNIL